MVNAAAAEAGAVGATAGDRELLEGHGTVGSHDMEYTLSETCGIDNADPLALAMDGQLLFDVEVAVPSVVLRGSRRGHGQRSCREHDGIQTGVAVGLPDGPA